MLTDPLRRIAAIVLPEIACEIAQRDHVLGHVPFAVIVDDDDSTVPQREGGVAEEVVDKAATLHAVDRRAWQYGARPGQTVSQASAYVGQLRIVRLLKSRVIETLADIAEFSLQFGTNSGLTLRIEDGRLPLRNEMQTARLRYPLGPGAGPYDTVWVDITGCSQLVGGDLALAEELIDRVHELGHRARVAIADGARIAQAIARWTPPAHHPHGALVVPVGESAAHLRGLPTAALPLPPDMVTWLSKLGILQVEDLAQLDRARLSHRLGANARDLLELIAGRDDVPLCTHQPTRRIVETTAFDHEIRSTEPLMFVLRGLVARAIARLTARGEACRRASIQLGFDSSVIRLKNRSRLLPLSPTEEFTLELPVPLSRENELIGALSLRLERTTLEAPVVTLSLVLDDLTEQSRHQLELGGKTGLDPSALPTLLAELQAQLGRDRVGVLEVVDTHRPEARTRLVSIELGGTRKKRVAAERAEPRQQELELEAEQEQLPTRILPTPIAITTPDQNALVIIDQHAFVVERLRYCARLDQVDWWSSQPIHRDYARAWLRADDHACEAWLFIDRRSGQAYVHGWYE